MLAWDALAQSLTELAARTQPAEAAQLRVEAAAAHERIVALAPDSWIVKRERAYALFAEGKWVEAIAVARAIMESSPRSWEHTYPYINLILSVGRLEETARIVGELQAIESLAMFVSRDQQWNLTALRRYDDAEAEYQRSKTLAGSYAEPEYNRFLRLLSREDTDTQALRDQYRLLQDSENGRLSDYLRELEPVLGDRPGMEVRTKAALSVEQLTVVADGRYANGEHLQLCDDAGITATVPRRIIPGSAAGLYQKADFNYDGERDLYRCPAGQELRRYAQDARRKLHLYRRTGCNQCPLQPQCTPSNARSVTRHFFEAAYSRSEARLQAEPGLMRKRASIAERPFAVLKGVLGFKRFSCRGLSGARAEMSIAVLGYNLLQTMQRIGAPRLMELFG